MWKQVNKLFFTKDAIKQILFILSRVSLNKFIKVVGGNKRFTNNIVKKFYIPLGHNYKILRYRIIFT